MSVSYTHLDVYKRQCLLCCHRMAFNGRRVILAEGVAFMPPGDEAFMRPTSIIWFERFSFCALALALIQTWQGLQMLRSFQGLEPLFALLLSLIHI